MKEKDIIKRFQRMTETKYPGYKCIFWLLDYEYYRYYEIIKSTPTGRQVLKRVELPYPRNRGIVNRPRNGIVYIPNLKIIYGN